MIQFSHYGNLSAEMQRSIFEQHKDMLYKVAFRYLNNQQESQDIMVDGFLKIFEQLPKHIGFGDEAHLKNWMCRIVINMAIQRLKRASVWCRIETEMVCEDATQPSVIDTLSAQELHNIIAKLPDGCRTVFNLFAVEGYKHAEIAQLLEISVGTSKSQFNRAKKLLKVKIENEKLIE